MGRKRAQMDVTLKLLLDSGDLRAGNGVLQVSTREQTRSADLSRDGIIAFEGERHRSLSSFAVAAIRSCGAVGRKTANGWQVVNYQGRPLEQYRAEFLEKESQASDSSGEAEHVMRKTSAKKRRMTLRLPPDEAFVAKQESASDREDTLRSSDSGGSRLSSPETTMMTTIVHRPAWTKSSAQKRARPSPTWLDAVRRETSTQRDALSPRLMTAVRKLPPPDALCGMKLEKTAPMNGGLAEEEEDDASQRCAVNMWLKKALNKRHKEECGMS